ncbi:LPS assembly lipoprotein LptE [Rubritalea sp.]|uniref:LPS assembly lipoprotein LptE n=1 Tax=Rubritalea sp. TaxID=2109375 RepID=UPI003EF8006E
MTFHILLLSALAFLFSSCAGYQVGNVKPAKLKDIQSITVPLFSNKTQEQRLAPIVTNSVVDEITRDGSFSISTASLADASLRGTIETIEYSEKRSNRYDTLRASEMYMEIIIRWELVDPQNKVLMSGTEEGISYFTVGTNQQTARNNTFPDASKNAAEKIVQRISSGF